MSCDCYQENQVGGAGAALLVGAAALLGYLIFARRSPVAPAAAAPAACPIDPQKLDRWGSARGFPVLYFFEAAVPPTFEELESAAPDLVQYANTPTQIVVVIKDGSFWYYIDPDALPPGVTDPIGRADNLRADYCSFTG